jgi:hypothetical protein
MQTLRTLFLFSIVVLFLNAGKPIFLETKTNWISLEQAAELLKKEKRPVLIDLYTDWCGWCKVMDRKTYANKKVADYLGNKFYTVKVDAESKQPIRWMGQEYLYNTSYKTNDFAIFLTGGQLSYPTTIILTSDGASPQAIPGFMEPKDFELILKYFGEGQYGKVPFSHFKSGFKGSW